MHRDPVHAVANLRVWIRYALGLQPAVHRTPGLPRVIRPEGTCCRDRGEHPLRPHGVQDDRVQAHPASARLPGRSRAVAAQTRQLLPGLAAIGGSEQSGVLDARIYGVRVAEGGLQVPDAFELPRVRRPVVPLVRPRRALVTEPVADRLPGRAAVVRSLDHLARPAAALRGVEPVLMGRRARHVIDLPAGEVRAADLPLVALAVGRQHERAFAGADQYSDSVHPNSIPRLAMACRSDDDPRRPEWTPQTYPGPARTELLGGRGNRSAPRHRRRAASYWPSSQRSGATSLRA